MGYYLTTEPETAVLPNSCAGSKTHTPDSPVQKRGFRYYKPEIGRWASRDPICEMVDQISGKIKIHSNLFESQSMRIQMACVYQFVGNNSGNIFDADGRSWGIALALAGGIAELGLNAVPVTTTCKGTCLSGCGIAKNAAVTSLITALGTDLWTCLSPFPPYTLACSVGTMAVYSLMFVNLDSDTQDCISACNAKPECCP